MLEKRGLAPKMLSCARLHCERDGNVNDRHPRQTPFAIQKVSKYYIQESEHLNANVVVESVSAIVSTFDLTFVNKIILFAYSFSIIDVSDSTKRNEIVYIW